MTRFALVLCVLLGTGWMLEFGSPSAHSQSRKTHKGSYTVFFVDTYNSSITLKDENKENHTFAVMGKALEKLDSLQAGMKIIVTCQDTESGEHEGLIDIEIIK